MKRTERNSWLLSLGCGLMLLVFMFAASPAETKAASITGKKPAFVTTKCGYMNTKVVLSWKKVAGAKKYQVYRSRTANGKYKKVATTTKTRYIKKTNGVWYYKVRAVRGSKKSKWSYRKHYFAARGRISQMGSGSYGSSLRVMINNRTSQKMVFKYGSQYCTIWLVNKKTGKPAGYCAGYLDVPSGYDKVVPANSTRYIDVETIGYLNSLGSTGLRNSSYYYMISYTFYGGGYRYAIGVTDRYSESSIAATTKK